jgi:large subunit ribosomal protein L35Ae
MLAVMKGVVIGFKRGPGGVYPQVALVRVIDAAKRSDVEKLVGSRVVARDKYGNVYEGRIVRAHGNNNVVRVRFRPNIPGQMIGELVEIVRQG